jgi:hypothetical protein
MSRHQRCFTLPLPAFVIDETVTSPLLCGQVAIRSLVDDIQT